MKFGTTPLYYAAAATTVIAGILHLIVASNVIQLSINNGIFFIVAGIAQIFWALPMVKRWGRVWYYIGIGGTIILIILWAMTRLPNNLITGERPFPINAMGITIEILQIAYIILTAMVIVKERSSNNRRVGAHTDKEKD
jgi:hypothetical protein